MQWQNVGGADFKFNLFETINVQAEYEHSDYHGRILKNSFPGDAPVFPSVNYIADAYYRQGNAVYGTLGAILSIIKLEAKYIQIDPDYVATASAVLDTSMPTKTDLAGVNPLIMRTTTYAGDPTMLWNNMRRLSIFGNVTIPNGYILVNYGKSEQIKMTGRDLYLEHFLIGNRLTGSLYWQLFYSNYGYPEAGMGDEFTAYNNLFLSGKPEYPYDHKMITDKWLTNKELIHSNYGDPVADPEGLTKKYYNNVSLEFRYALNKLVGLENNLFVQAYAELAMLTDKNDFTVNFTPSALLSQQIITAFAVYNLTKKINVMVEWGIERWVTNQCAVALDEYDTSYGAGFDYDFAPRTALFLRVKRFTHDDKIMPAANFNGWQMFMELKNFF
jgi:hypothetical protein